MNHLRAWIKGFFGFSRTETNAFLIMLPLMAILVFSEPVYHAWFVRPAGDSFHESKTLDSILASWNWDKTPDSSAQPLFAFDPNTATFDELKKLGLPKKLSDQIIHYRAKGGKFRIKNDLSKIYGMDSSLFIKLAPFISLPTKMFTTHQRPLTMPLRKKIQLDRYDLNLADTSRLTGIYGIGRKLSMRIAAYRDRLGGFVSMEQLHEVYGLDSAVVDRITKYAFIRDDFKPRQLNINTTDEKELRAFPYFKFPLARAIGVFRFQHGPFTAIEDLMKIPLIDETTFQKIKPYITVKD